MKRLAIVTTHPIQYYAPVFKLLSDREVIEIKVFYTWGKDSQSKYDPGFDKVINWDLPLLDGYPYEWLENSSKDPGSHNFKGIRNPEITARIEAFKPDALLVIGWAYSGHLKSIRFFKSKVPVIFRGDSILPPKGNRLKKLLRYLSLRWIYGHVDFALYVGTNSKKYFKKYGLKDNQLAFAPHAVDNERFARPRIDDVSKLQQKLSINEQDIVVLFSGKLENVKSPLLLLNAFLKLKPAGVHLIFAGDGYLESQLKSITGTVKNVHFLGFQNQTVMPVIYQTCDLFCLPSVSETWGLAVNEAMACGKAVLVSDKVGSAADLVQVNSNGMIFKSGDEPDLFKCLEKLTADKELLRLYGKRSLELIKPWTFENIATAIEETMTFVRS